MKKILATITLLLVVGAVLAQAPNLINYQAIARDNGQLYKGSLDVRFTIRNGSCTGTPVFSEEHLGLNTNAYGLFNAKIGGGNLLSGSFTAINWNSGGAHFLEVELRFAGNSSYTALPCSSADQFASVPYALNGPAGVTGPTGAPGPSGAPGATGPTGASGSANINGTPKFLLKSQTPTFANSSIIYQDSMSTNGAQRIGIGNTAPKGLLHVGDPNSTTVEDIIFDSGNTIPFGNTKTYGTGAKMIWNSVTGAFRVGVHTNAGEWNGSNMGGGSAALGYNVMADKTGSIAIGASSRAGGVGSLVMGSYLETLDSNMIVLGFGNTTKKLINNKKYSLMLGALSPVPSLYIDPPRVLAYGDKKPGNITIGGISVNSNSQAPTNFPRSTLEIAGSMAIAVDFDPNAIVNPRDTNAVVILTAANVTVQLPTASSAPGRIYYFKRNTSSGSFQLKPAATDHIDGGALNTAVLVALTSFKEAVIVVSDGNNGWWVLSGYK